jgi:hypothetical protein
MAHSDATVAAVRHHFDAEVVDVRPRHGGDGIYPEDLAGHPRTIGPIAPCADCADVRYIHRATLSLSHRTVTIVSVSRSLTWAQYGTIPLCGPCAWARWRQSWL